MPRLQITKDGEVPTIVGPEQSQEACEAAAELVSSSMMPALGGEGSPEGIVDLGWVQVANVVIAGVTILPDLTELDHAILAR